jgi:hypothetical protein
MDQVNDYDYEFTSEALMRVDIPPVAAARMHRLPP